MSQLETTVRVVDGLATRVLDRGTGRPIVVLHGWGGRIESMAPVISCLGPRFRTIAIDLPGFGGSPLPETVWGTPEYAVHVAKVLAGLGVESAGFVGHSFGAKTSLYLAATRSELVDRLVLVGSPGLRAAPSPRVRAKRALSRAGRLAGALGATALRDAVYRKVASSDYRDAGPLRPVLVRVVNEDLADLLPRIAAPTLLVWGERDDAVPLRLAHRMERLIPDAGLVVFEGAGHFAYLDDAPRFCAIVRHFFEGGSG